jgi:Type ISP C-terminal specificity domain/N-6 DNA Methylase
VSTAEQRASGGADYPDVALYDAGDFPAVYAEAKLPEVQVEDIAFSTGSNDQVGRYLSRTGAVLVTNVRAVALISCKPGYTRTPGTPVPPGRREILDDVELWPSLEAFEQARPIAPQRLQELADLIERAVTEFAPIAEPSSLARILARQARRAKADLPDEIKTVASLLEDYRTALGLSFTTDAGEEFFRSSLIQTAYYGLFAGWTLWHRANDGSQFEWERLDKYLRIPFLAQLFYEFRHPDRLAELKLAPHLDRAAETLGRVDRGLFFARFHSPTLEEQDAEHTGALIYFYEPFLEAFDPTLRKELGVWFTPPEVVQYQVRRIERLLREELGCATGFADERVVVLDPCCGTGAYLLEVMRCIAAEIRDRGDDALLGSILQKAVVERIMGFEILTAPFVVAQLQLYLLLAELGGEPKPPKRPAVFLTNALTGWGGEEQVKLNFPELQEEHDSAQTVKRKAKIIVILGNPPYNRFAGEALDEEADLVDHYKGVERVVRKDKSGNVKVNSKGEPILVQKGESLLYKKWKVRKQLLDDLYIRFFRLAERQIGEKSQFGVFSFISNSSYLTGRSHPIMRESLLTNFHEIWIDNLNGDKYRTGKVIPEGLPGEGTTDQSIFSTEHDPRGIQVGTCVCVLVKRKAATSPPTMTRVNYREFWGRADAKRRALVDSLGMESWGPAKRLEAGKRPEGPRTFESFYPSEAGRWRLSIEDIDAGYESWPGVDELFPEFIQGVNPNRGLEGSLIDTDQARLVQRMQRYFAADNFEEIIKFAPELVAKRAGYDPRIAWRDLREHGAFQEESIRPYLVFPLDARWIYYEKKAKLLNRPRPEFYANLEDNEFLLAVPDARHVSEARPLFARTLVDLHTHDRGSACFPRDTRVGPLVSARVANIAPAAWKVLRDSLGLHGDRDGADAKALVAQLFRCALAVLHSPHCEEDHRDALAHDWAHLPVPKDPKILDRLIVLGDQLAALLDPLAKVGAMIRAILGAERAARLGVITSKASPPDLRVTVSYFGAAKGRWVEREFAEGEDPLVSWGKRTGELYLNDDTWLANVPERVWRHELGGYPVIRKWLGYRSADRRGGAPLTIDEVQHLRSIVQRLATLLALQPELDAVYESAAADAFTAEELGVRS